jgi:hypothetical protein
MFRVGLKGMCGVLACVLSTVTAAPARADEERPSTGTGQIVVGWIGTGVGTLNLVTLPVCYADFYPEDAKDLCVGASIGFAAVGLGIGIPFLIVGYGNRADYKKWKAEHPTAHELSKLRLSAVEGGGVLGYQTEF